MEVAVVLPHRAEPWIFDQAHHLVRGASEVREPIGRAHGHRDVRYMGVDRPAIVDFLCESTRSGDLVLTLGAGDVGALGAEVLAGLGAPGDRRERR